MPGKSADFARRATAGRRSQPIHTCCCSNPIMPSARPGSGAGESLQLMRLSPPTRAVRVRMDKRGKTGSDAIEIRPEAAVSRIASWFPTHTANASRRPLLRPARG